MGHPLDALCAVEVSVPEFEIDAVQWFDRELGHQGIKTICNRKDGWGLSIASAILRMSSGDRFYVMPMSGKKVYIQVVKPDGATPYLRTFIDDRLTDHLLSLPVMKDIEMID